MWIVRIALSRPFTFVVLALLLFLAAPILLVRTLVDVFPAIDVPVASIIWTYTGRVLARWKTGLRPSTSGHLRLQSPILSTSSRRRSMVLPLSKFTCSRRPTLTEPSLRRSYCEASAPLHHSTIGRSLRRVSCPHSTARTDWQRPLQQQQLNDIGVNFIRPQLAAVSSPTPCASKRSQTTVTTPVWSAIWTLSLPSRLLSNQQISIHLQGQCIISTVTLIRALGGNWYN